MGELEKLYVDYQNLLNQFDFDVPSLDYSLMTGHRVSLDLIAQLNNCGVTVFDLYKREHVYTSYNFNGLFGFDMQALSQQGNEYFNSKSIRRICLPRCKTELLC